MSGWLAELALILLTAIAFSAATAAAVSLAWPTLRALLRRLPPAVRARSAFAISLAPAVAPVALVALCLAPGLPALFGWRADHCLAHADHPHLCLAHPSFALTAPLSALLVAAGVLAIAALARLARQLRSARRCCAALERSAAGVLAPGVTLVRSGRPFSLAAGLWQPRIWISTVLAHALPADRLAVVIEHERGHVRRRDALCRWLAATGALPLWPSVRRALLAELALASEQACDEDAGARIGDRLFVAETILAVERLLGARPAAEPVGVLAFGGSTVPERVRSLLAPTPRAIPARYLALAGVAVVLAAALGADRLHHVTEHVLGALLS